MAKRERERMRAVPEPLTLVCADEVPHQGADHFHKRFVVSKFCLSLALSHDNPEITL